MHKFTGVLGARVLSGWERYWHPTLSRHDPSPPLRLESAPEPPFIKLNNYLAVRVGDGMSCTERIR